MSNSTREATATGRQRPNDSQRERTALFAGVLLFGLVLGTFLPALSNGFVGFDDPDYVTENGHVQAGLTWESVQWAFRSTEAANWHPVTRLSHMLDCELFGLAPWGHHLTSILLHAVNATLLFLVLREMTGATWRSFTVALLFGVHPLRVESVAWIAERKDVLSTMFWMLTLWAYSRYAEVQSLKSKVQCLPAASNNILHASRIPHHASRFTFHVSRYYLLSLCFFSLGLMSKPMLVTLPCVLLLLDYWPLGRLRLETARGLVTEKLPFFLAAAAVSGVTFVVQKQGGAVAGSWPVTDRVANAVVSYCRYLGKLFWPVDLAAFYPRIDHWPVTTVLAAGLLLLVISVAAIALRRGHPYATTGWLWFLGTLVPVIGLVQVGGQSMADRYSYVPSIGIFLVLVWGAHELTCGWRYQGVGAVAIAAATALLCAGLTRAQIGYWKDGESLCRHAILVTKDNYNAHYGLGSALDRQGRVDEAISEYREALREKDDYAEAHNNLGVDLAQQGRLSEGMNQFLAALKIKPGYADPHNNIGTTLEKQGRFDEALEQFQEALRLHPDFPDAHYNLGVALGRKGRSAEAAREFQRVLELRPNYAEAHNNLGVMLDRQGQIDEAARQYAEAARLNPGYASAHYNLGVALARQGRLEQAIAEFQQTLRLKPDHTAAQSNLAAALAMKQTVENKPGGAKQP
jgi:tetratricopeptide (TPR) repeat protein